MGDPEERFRGARRRAVLDAVRAAVEPQGVAELANALGVHVNTVRFHLDALVAEGAVSRRTQRPAGRGRPRTVYTGAPGMDRGGARGYRLLAQVLVGGLAAKDAQGRGDAEAAGHAWGGFLVDVAQPPATTGAAAAARLAALLADLGFEPAVEPDAIRLRHCPFLELAEEHGQVVCSVHLGLMRGALAAMSAPLTAGRLEPFAAPGSCLARLAPVGPRPEGAPG
ncbi:helix-turn-helix transcriptional regulator [Streptomyces sp. NRRL F-5123]|uniref:helix-turn-helix transcriptional regulator n=1 Tax=Streptomyces sp. NRRL F-5123 TaxID=1463856 RepID=UPI0004E0B30E|nr:helix-turn-helix domain-containing protein [Streptomyces sp. NRRL F-5123]